MSTIRGEGPSPFSYALDGSWTVLWRCPAHSADLWRLQEAAKALKAACLSEPVPNRDGLLATYLPGDGWTAIHQRSAPTWQPSTHGVNADTWPPAEPAPSPPSLAAGCYLAQVLSIVMRAVFSDAVVVMA